MPEPVRTVLIVDDEPMILKLVEKMLRPRNYRIQAAPKPSDALRIAESETVDLLISDIALPEMEGHRLAEKVLALHPQAQVLLISGHYRDKPKRLNSDRVRFLAKPFFPSDLLEALRKMLPEE